MIYIRLVFVIHDSLEVSKYTYKKHNFQYMSHYLEY